MSIASERVLDALRNSGYTVNVNSRGAMAQCPAHKDRNPSLSITPIEGSVLLHCFADCDTADVLAAVGLTKADLYDSRNGARYDYSDGRCVYRSPDKRFRQANAPRGSGAALFHAERIGDAPVVYAPEGEKDVLAVEAAGGVAVCSAMGAGKAAKFDWSVLDGKHVVIIADKDDPGRKHAVEVVNLVRDIAAAVRVVEAATGKDAADHIAAGHGLDDFVDANWWKPAEAPAAQPEGPSESEFFNRDGLRARVLANTVMQSVRCGFSDTDERFYVYNNGVWLPNRGTIEAEIAHFLGDRYRNTHSRNALDLIRYSPNTQRITCDPLPQYINVRNGMLNWATGELLDHSAEYRSTVQLPVAYDPAATCPHFDRFLAEVLPKDCYEPTDESPSGFVWELIGYTLYSGNPLHIAVLLYGRGRNGKGALIRTLKRLLGDRNCATAGLHELAENRFRTATLFGKLANLAGDLDGRWLNNTATFKAITGGDWIQGEHKYGAAFDFQPWALPFYSTNKAFGSADSSEGWVARWVVVPFPTSFLGREDRQLEARLQSDAELRGILARGAHALPALIARGRLPEPKTVREAKAAFVAASDAVRSWLDEECVVDREAWTPRKTLYYAYSNHAEGDGSKRLSAREFYQRVDQINAVRSTTRQGTRGFTGVRLRTIGDWTADHGPGGAEGAEGAGSPPPNHAHRGKGTKPAPSAPCPASSPASTPQAAPQANNAYINGMCVDCGTKPYSAGRPRCNECHRIWLNTTAGYNR